MDKVGWIVLAFIAGALLPLQGAFNARLGAAAGSPMHASLISFLIGTSVIALWVIAAKQSVSWAGLLGAPWYSWLGGLCGAFALSAIILTFPRLGPGLAFGLLVAGQLIVSVGLEHFNILVAQPHPISFLRLAGVVLVLSGVGLIRAF